MVPYPTIKISVVTISYNQGGFLEEAIRSVLAQQRENLEYIVVDAGSTDESREIIKRYQRKLHATILEADRGPADGLNKGFARATGDVFGFLNADDVLYPGALSRVAAFFSDHPDIAVVSGHSAIIDGTGRLLRRSYSDSFSLRRHAYGASILMQPSTFFRARCYRESSGFNIENRSSWDAEFFVDIAMRGARFARIDTILSGYRLHAESITQSGKLDELSKKHAQRMFGKIMGREPRWYDLPLSAIYRVEKYALQPRSLVERLAKGRIYRRPQLR